MPPKKPDPKGGDVSQVPEVEELVELPAEVGDVPEPHFCFVLGHLVGHPLRVEELPKPPAEGEEVPVDPGPLAVNDFDPCAMILAKAKEPGDPFLKSIVIVDREELERAATADPEEEKSLAWALRQRLEKERAARKRKKWNDARRKALAALEAAKAAEEAGEAAAAGEEASKTAEDESSKLNNFMLILNNYGTTPEELQEIAAEGFCAEGLVDLFCAVYLVGETVEERDGGRMFTVPEAPALVDVYYNAIHAAPINTDLANSTVCTFAKSHTLAHPPGDVSPVEHVIHAVLEFVGVEAARRQQFGKWLRDAKPVPGPPSLGPDRKSELYGESRLYQRLMGSVDPLHHDVPLFLHCLTEQVNLTQSGDAQKHEDQTAMCSLEEYLGAAKDDFVSDGKRPVPTAKTSTSGLGADETPADAVGKEVEKTPLLPHLDFAHCMHSLAGGGFLDGGDAVVDKNGVEQKGDGVVEAVHKALGQLCGPGAQRSGLPKDAVHSAAQRAALRCRIYPFAPSVPTAEIEQLLLLHAFQDLLKGAQPERPWDLSDRIYRERISRQYLSQTLKAAFANEPAMRTAYLPRHDCLLVALHHRSLPGSVMWHAWKGDLRKPSDPSQWQGGLFTTPTYNDWAYIIGKDSSGTSQVPQPSCLLQGVDARQLGYISTVEKLATPPDGSTILVTKFQHGIETSLPFPSAAYVEAAIAEPPALNDAGSSSGVADVGEAPPAGRTDAFEAPVRHTSKLTRVMKDSMAFGFVDDGAWAARCQDERERRAAETAADAAAAAAAKAAAEEAPGSRPVSPPVVNPDEIPLSEPMELSFPGVNFGQFWMAFPDGARCSARMHHEIAPLNAFEDQSRAKPPLGVLFAYSLAAGLVIQVFSDGAVRLIFPLAVPGSEDGPAAAPVRSQDQAQERLPSGYEPHFKPGCPEDVELMRTVTPIGTVIRKLLSGRVEVHYTDGSTSIRNPTEGELQMQLDDLRQKVVETGGARVELLERLCKFFPKELSPLSVKPDEKQKAAGLPGHWVVTRPDGSMYGRAAASLRMPTPKPKTPSPIPDDAGDADPGADAGDGAPAAREATPKPRLPPLDQLLGGVWVDGGSCVEYPIVQGVSVATHVDIQTQHRTTTSSHGVAMYEDPDDLRSVVVHSDGTRVVKIRRDGGHEIVVTKEKMAVVRCDFTEVRGGMNLCVFVECVDGTRLEVLPQTLSGSGLKIPLQTNAADFDSLSTHARVTLRRSKGPIVVSHGLGQVDIHYSAEDTMGDPEYPMSLDDMTPAYVASCSEGRLMTQSADGMLFEVHGDQTLAVSGGPAGAAPESPRCSMPDTAYMTPGMEEVPPPGSGPPPRLFVIYGQGDAEELLTESDVGEALRAAQAEPDTIVVEGEFLGPPLEVCRCHTIFQTKTLHSYQAATQHQQSLMVSSVGSLDTGWSLGSAPPLPPPPVAPAITKFRQFIQYPTITEEKQTCFLGTLKQYRAWEQEELRRNRAVMQIEVKSSGKDKKGDKSKKKGDKGADKGKKDKEKKRSSTVDIPEMDDAKMQPEPAFASDLKLNAFEHLVQVLALRAEAQPEPTDADLLEAAKADRDAQAAAELEQRQGDASPTGEGTGTFFVPLPELGYEVAGEEAAEEAPAPPADEDAAPEAEAPAEPEEQDRRHEMDTPILRLLRPKVADAPTFAYFKSERGLQFLMDAGELDPERKPRQRGERPNKKSTPPPQPNRSPWNPRLLGEEVEDEQAREDELEAVEEDRGPAAVDMEERTPHWGADGEQGNMTRGYEGDPYGMALPSDQQGFGGPEGTMNPQGGGFQPQARLPIVAEATETPQGPHPDKKQNIWDIYGQPRTAKPSQSHAYVALNTDYLEVEGATDRRVRTSSIAHKKNAGKAPSVQSVRKTGTHALGRGSEVAAGEILGELGVANPEEHWKLTSTMQGLGDCNNLVEVTPGKCRFGVLRQGQLYRMAFYLRNLDVDVTRFNVIPPDSKLVIVRHQPGQLAPGMAAKIVVEVAARKEGVLQQLVEVRLKAHVVRVPVTAKILEAEEFDRLDTESFATQGRRIGRHRERANSTGKRPVEVVTDEMYARKLLEEDYLPAPPEFEDTMGATGNTTGDLS